MPNKKGELIFWEIPEMDVDREEIETLGFGHLVPRNQYRAAMLRAIKKLTKGRERMYRKFNDRVGNVQFGVFSEHVNGSDISLDKELIISLDKVTGSTTSNVPCDFYEKIKELYSDARESLDSSQLRSLILRIVKRQYAGIAMRKSGGIYFIDKTFSEDFTRLESLFRAFPDCRLHRVPIYDDNGTVESLEHAASEDIGGEIAEIMAAVAEKMRKGMLTRRQLEGKVKEAEEIFTKLEVHKDNLKSKYELIKDRLEKTKANFKSLMDGAGSVALDPSDFMAELRGLALGTSTGAINAVGVGFKKEEPELSLEEKIQKAMLKAKDL